MKVSSISKSEFERWKNNLKIPYIIPKNTATNKKILNILYF